MFSSVSQIIEVIPQSDEVNHLVQELDQFYQLVNIHTGEPINAQESLTTSGSDEAATSMDVSSMVSAELENSSSKDLSERDPDSRTTPPPLSQDSSKFTPLYLSKTKSVVFSRINLSFSVYDLNPTESLLFSPV